jgi:hypothetical protein
MSLTTKNQLLIAFKKLVGKAHTNSQFGSANESVASNVQIDNSTIFAQRIPSSPSSSLYSLTNNIVEKIQFNLVSIPLSQYTAVGAAGGGITFDGDGAPAQGTFTNGIHAYALTLPTDYQVSSSNPKKGTGVYVNGQSLTASNGTLQIVPERYGSLYPAVVSSSSGILAALDEEDYLLDPYSGILFLQDINRVPTSVTAYIYVGDYLNQTVSGTTAQFTTVSASIVSASVYVGLPTFSSTPGGTNQTIQFNSGSTFSGSTNLIYNYTTNVLSGTTAQFTTITASNGFISGGLVVGNYVQMFPVGALSIPTNQTASYIYTSGSTNDLYFTQYQPGTNFTNTTRLRWLESLLNTGLLHGGVLSTVNGTTSFSVTSGSGLIVTFNASTSTDPYPTVRYVTWPATISQSLSFTGSAEITYISIDSNGGILQSITAPSLSQFKDRIFLGRVLHQTGSVTNGAFNTPATAYAVASNTADFIRAIGPLKISGHVLAASGSTLSLTKTSGDSYVEGRNYTNNPNIPNVISSGDDPALTVSKIYREYISGSTTIIDTGIANAGYTTVDPGFYSNNGVLTALGPSEYSVQRVFWFPRGINRALFIYYGQNKYANINDAIDAVSTEAFTEADNTKGSAILVGYIVLRGNALDLTNSTDARIFQAGIFRGSSGGGAGIGGATVPGDGNGSVQYNDAGVFGGDNGFTYNKSTNALFLSGSITSLTTISGTTATFTSATASNITIVGTASLSNIVNQAYINFNSASNRVEILPGIFVKGNIETTASISASTAQFGTVSASLYQGLPELYRIITTTSVQLDSTQVSVFAKNTVSSSIILTLPSAAAAKAKEYYFVKADTLSGSVRISASGSNLINGLSNFDLNGPYQSVTLITDGSDWYIF